VLDDRQKQQIIAMVCSDPAQGRARWTVHLVAEEAVKRRTIPSVADSAPGGSASSPRTEVGFIEFGHAPHFFSPVDQIFSTAGWVRRQ
jgi:hypothetical protein